MLEADNTGNYELFIKALWRKDLVDFSNGALSKWIKHMQAQNGMTSVTIILVSYKAYREGDHDGSFRFVWKGFNETWRLDRYLAFNAKTILVYQNEILVALNVKVLK